MPGKCTFNRLWLKDDNFKSWLVECKFDRTKALCKKIVGKRWAGKFNLDRYLEGDPDSVLVRICPSQCYEIVHLEMYLSQIASKRTAEEANLKTKQEKKKSKKRKKKDPNEPQKPVSAYALFFRDTQAAIKGQKPNASFGEVSKIVASMWDGLEPDTKEVYKKKTEAAKKEYLKKLAAYRASVVSQETPDTATTPSGAIDISLLTDTKKKKGTRGNKIQESRATISSNSSSISSIKQSVGTAITVNKQTAGPTSIGINPSTSSSVSDTVDKKGTSLRGQTIQIPRSLLEQAANKPVTITVTQSSGKGGEKTTKVITVMVPKEEIQKLQTMKHLPTSSNQAVASETALLASAYEPVKGSQQKVQIQPTEQNNSQPTISHNNLEPGEVSPGDLPALSTCQCIGCSNPPIDSPYWDNEYCSNECVASHCSDVFTAWVAARQGSGAFA